MLNSLSGRFLILTVIFVMLAEVLIFVPSVARFREDFLLGRLERAQIASLALLADEMISPELEAELLDNAGVYNVVLRRDQMRELVLSSPVPGPIAATYDLRDPSALQLIAGALSRLLTAEPQIIRVIGSPLREAGQLIEVTMDTADLRAAMLEYGLRILLLSAMISIVTASLLFFSVRVLLVRPIKGVVGHMQAYAAAPEDARRVIKPSASVRELREAEEALQLLQTQMTQALRQKERLAQLGGAVARVSHDLRNILTSAQLFTDRIERSEDPAVRRLAPKLVNSITRAVSLCESTLAFGRAEEPAPTLTLFNLAELAHEVLEAERLAIDEHDLSLSDDIPAGMMIRGDPEQIYRALSNMVRNARQAIVASGKPGEINLTAFHDDDD
uniref:histidine kinase dimerization/phospho-acceptor domain-containing protein n=1 Tax=Citreimonas sp. TaxID=3036715 RepID=UPI0035C807D0